MSNPSTPHDKKKHNASVSEAKLECQLNIKDFEALQEAFSLEGDGYNNQLALTRDQFTEALSLILNKGTRDEYGALFDKVDTAKEGTVDWNKLASHMLLEFYEKDDRVKSNLLPQWKDLRNVPGPHKDTIQRIAFLKNLGRYLIISKEGNVSLWGNDVKMQRSIKVNTDTCRQRDLWITDFIPMPNVGRVALSFTSKEIAFYDMNVKLDFNCQYKLFGLTHTPLCLEYWSNPDNSNESIMLWGDVAGNINILFWTSASIALFERPSATQDKEAKAKRQLLGVNTDKDMLTTRFEMSSKTMMNIYLSDIVKGIYKSVRYLKHQCHSDWVRQVKFLPNLESFISCATTWDNSMVIGWMEKHSSAGMQATVVKTPNRRVVRQSLFEVHQGINAFDYHDGFNLIATAGVNHHVCLWNPYVVSKPNGLLRGHMAPVLQVRFVKSRGQLLSFSKDKVLRIWDVQLQVCIQRLAGVFPKGQDVDDDNVTSKRDINSLLFFHDDRCRLFITFNYTLTLLEMKPDAKDKVQSHDRAVVCTIFNTTYNQIISACQGGTVIFWMVDTGQKVKSFSGTHGDAELTCMVQDESETRLFTGSTDGSVKIWDFNGHCYHQLICTGGHPADVGQIVLLRRSIIVVGFSRDITIFRNNTLRDYHVEPSEWKGKTEHSDDILAAAFYATQTLATGSYDGEIIIWNTNSEQGTRRMTERSKVKKDVFAFNSVKEPSSLSIHKTQKTLNTAGSVDGDEERPVEDSQVSGEADISEFMYTISRLMFLENRKATFTTRCGANLISCGGNGIVRFWNAHSCVLLGEFTAHEHAGSIIMKVDPSNKVLVTGDVDGLLKVWSIETFCLEDGPLISTPPTLLGHWQAHSDMISCITFCERQKRLLIISSSSDMAISVWDVKGNKIGTFGQEEHWKIEDELEMRIVEEEFEIQGPDDVTRCSIVQSVSENSYWEPDALATEDPDQYRINTWDSSCLGKDYQALRVKKRQRKQPESIPDLPYLHSERTGQPPFGPFYALTMANFNDVEELEQPDFMEHPERYFTDKEDLQTTTGTKASKMTALLAENSNKSNVGSESNRSNALKAAFDEKTLLPRYVLDYDLEMKKISKSTLEKINKINRSQATPQNSLNMPNGAMTPSLKRNPKPGIKLKPIGKSRDRSSISSADSR